MTKQQSAWRSPWVIGWIVALVAFIIISGTRVYFAIKTDPGLVDKNFYERGQDYEDNMLKHRALEEQVRMQIHPPEFIEVDKEQTYEFSIADKDGQALRPDHVTLYAFRPADAKRDFSVQMEEMQEGRYRAEASFPLKGVWEIVFTAKVGDEEFSTPAFRFSAGVHTPKAP